MNYTLEDHFAYFCEELALSKSERMRLSSLIKETPHINWRDALGPSQLRSKRLLVQQLQKWPTRETEIISIGGWIGLTEYLLKLARVETKRHISLEIDREAIEVSYKLNAGTGNFINLYCNALDFNYQLANLIVINTSCEHLSDFSGWFKLIPDGTRCIFQSNNMFAVEDHVNCHETLAAFIKSAPLQEIEQALEIDIGNNWKRFMMVGIK